MHYAVINVRLSNRGTTASTRIDIRNCDLALSTIGQKVLLYAPRENEPSGYCGEAIVLNVVPDPIIRASFW